MSDSFLPVMLLLALAAAGTVLARMIRNWWKQPDVPPESGFTLHELRKLVREGKMTDEEYKKASALVARAQTAQLLPPAKTDPKPDKQE